MSLYFDAANILLNSEGVGGSLKSRIFNNKKLKNAPAHVYALVAQATKWSPILKEVIEKRLRLALLVAFQRAREGDELREGGFEFSRGHSVKSAGPGRARQVCATERFPPPSRH